MCELGNFRHETRPPRRVGLLLLAHPAKGHDLRSAEVSDMHTIRPCPRALTRVSREVFYSGADADGLFLTTVGDTLSFFLTYRHSAQRAAALVPHRFYNHRRPHASLGRRAPWTRFQEAA